MNWGSPSPAIPTLSIATASRITNRRRVNGVIRRESASRGLSAISWTFYTVSTKKL